jgi:biotin transport system substrate-specific component
MRTTGLVDQAPLELICRSRVWLRAAVMCTLMAALTALAAQVRIPLPFTPVPMTLQVFVVLLSAGLLGSRLGAISQLEYALIGACGLPVFSGGNGGLAALAGPTGGYIAGFAVCAFVVGWLLDRGPRSFPATLAACVLGIALIYLPGWLWLSCWMSLGPLHGSAWLAAFRAGVVPFIAIDALKACAAAALVWAARRATA